MTQWLHVLLVSGWLLFALTFSFLWGKRAGDIHAINGAPHPRWAYFYEFVSNFVAPRRLVLPLRSCHSRQWSGTSATLTEWRRHLPLFRCHRRYMGCLAETIRRFIDAIGAFVAGIAKKLEP